nr:protein tas-like [Nerophis lumbriciformis]
MPGAQAGDSEAQNYIGELYEKGIGISPDYNRAAQWFRKAADQGSDELAFTSSIAALEAQIDSSSQRALQAERETGQLRGQIQQLQGQVSNQRSQPTSGPNAATKSDWQYRPLGRSDIQVSPLCLGTMTFGEQNDEADGHAQLDYALDHGINFLDTAEMYAVPVKAETYGRTEEIIGTWLAARNNRDKIVVATKVIGPGERFPWIRDGSPRLNRAHIEAVIDDSLKRLQTDYIDLYQLHWPERNTNTFGQLGYEHKDDEDGITALRETLEVLADLVKAGKVRTVGASNETPWGMMRFFQLADELGLPRMVSIQNPYNLLNRTYEVGLSEVSIREDCGLLAYGVLASGMLTVVRAISKPICVKPERDNNNGTPIWATLITISDVSRPVV